MKILRLIVDTLAGFCGYSRVPLTAVQISMRHEALFKKMYELNPNDPARKSLYKSANALTELLRSCRKAQSNKIPDELRDEEFDTWSASLRKRFYRL